MGLDQTFSAIGNFEAFLHAPYDLPHIDFASGLSELDAAVQKANAKRAKEGTAMADDERRKLVSTEQSLGMDPEPRIPTAISGLETFSLTGSEEDEEEGEKSE